MVCKLPFFHGYVRLQVLIITRSYSSCFLFKGVPTKHRLFKWSTLCLTVQWLTLDWFALYQPCLFLQLWFWRFVVWKTVSFPIALKWADKDLCKRKLTEKDELWFSQVTESEMQTTCDSAKTWLSRNSLELKSQQTACFSSLRFFSILLHPLNTAFWKVDWYVQEQKQKNKLILWCAHSFAFNCGIISGRIRDVFLSVLLDYDSVLVWFQFWLCYWRKPALKVQVACTYSSVWFWLNFLPN